MGETMQMTELDHPIMEDRKYLEKQIKELEQKIVDAREKRKDAIGLSVVDGWNKELLRLRRLRK